MDRELALAPWPVTTPSRPHQEALSQETLGVDRHLALAPWPETNPSTPRREVLQQVRRMAPDAAAACRGMGGIISQMALAPWADIPPTILVADSATLTSCHLRT